MTGRRISVTASLKRHQRGWLLRWYDRTDPRYPIRLSYWFADQAEALKMQTLMRSGLSFDDSLCALWRVGA